MAVITSHHFGKASRITNLVIEDVPSILVCFFPDFSHCCSSLRPSVVVATVGGIIDNDADHIYLMAPVISSELIERIVEQWKTDGREELGSDGNEDIARGVIRGLSEYGLSRRAVDEYEGFILEVIGNEPC